MNRRKTAAILAALLAFSASAQTILPGFSGSMICCAAEDAPLRTVTVGNLTFNLYSDHAAVSRCSESAMGKMEIPDSAEGLPVTHILDGSFAGCTALTEVIMPEPSIPLGSIP